jgi:hypothetical protein
MNDWRSKPRTGKGEFMQYADKINQRINAGDTQTQIYEDLKKEGMALSYSQFNRYVNTHILNKKGKDINLSKIKYTQNEKSVTSTTKNEESTQIDLTQWHRINIKRKPLIERLVKEGFTPTEVDAWGLSNESQISNKLNLILMNRG